MLNLKYKVIICKSGPLIQTDGTLYFNWTTHYKLAMPALIPWSVARPHPPNQLFTPYFKQNNKKSCLWFWNSWSEFLNTTRKTQEDKFKDVSILKILFTKEKKRSEYGSTGVKTPLKNGLGKEPILEHLPCQSIKMIISEDYSETLRIVKKCKLDCCRSLKYLI